jgi:2-amino-4-hydroxy-6-hydroxymethyldihydropteridine diphosphokinase
MHSKFVFIGLGSNIGDKIKNIQMAIEEISKKNKIIQTSSFYKSPPWGFESTESFINAVIEIETNISPMELYNELKNIEEKLGRKNIKSYQYEDRTIDLDILYFQDQIINNITIQIPHKSLHLRKFVLEPLYEIAPYLIDPEKNITIDELLKSCPDNSKIEQINQ